MKTGIISWFLTSARERSGRSGFTAVELLVVVSIIAILTSLVLPALKTVRAAARSTQCMSNLRSMGVALNAYTGDYRSFVPPGCGYGYREDWKSILRAYMDGIDSSKVFTCPGAAIRAGNAHYSAQFSLFPDLNRSGGERSKIGRTPELRPDSALFFDGSQDPSSGNANPLSWNQAGMWEYYGENAADDLRTTSASGSADLPYNYWMRWRHAGNRVSVLYGDMHVASRTAETMAKGELRCLRNGRKHNYEWWIH